MSKVKFHNDSPLTGQFPVALFFFVPKQDTTKYRCREQKLEALGKLLYVCISLNDQLNCHGIVSFPLYIFPVVTCILFMTTVAFGSPQQCLQLCIFVHMLTHSKLHQAVGVVRPYIFP